MQDMDGGPIGQMGRTVDMVEDPSEAGKACLEAEYHGGAIDAMEEGGDAGGRSGGRQGHREPCMMDDGDGEGRMGYRDRYGNFPADPKNRRRQNPRPARGDMAALSHCCQTPVTLQKGAV